LFAWLPDLTAVVDRWSGQGDTLFVELRLRATLSGRPVEWAAVDRFTLRGRLAIERVSYFNAVPLLLRVLSTPSSWPRAIRMGAARPWV
jgi:hypothetical protein